MIKISERVEQDDLRARMRAAGMTYDEIAVEFARRFRLRPRAACRVAHGWTQQQAANHINAHAAHTGLDPAAAATMTAPRISELENWPLPNRRRLTPQTLALLAEVYGTSIHNLIDLDDREHLTPADQLLISRLGRAVERGNGGGQVVRSGMEGPPRGNAVVPSAQPRESPASEDPTNRGTRPRHASDLSGVWWAAWQSFKDGAELVAVQQVAFVQAGDLIDITALARGRPVQDGGYLWRGELQDIGGQVLMGWYAADDGPVRSMGTLFLNIHTQGLSMVGRWTGLSYDGPTVTGWASLSRSEAGAHLGMRRLCDAPVVGA